MIDDRTLESYLGALSAEKAVAVKQRLDDLRRDCGCGVGSIVMLGATGAWIVHACSSPSTGRSWGNAVLSALLVLFVSASVGKLMGLGLARSRFYLLVRALRRDERRLSPPGT